MIFGKLRQQIAAASAAREAAKRKPTMPEFQMPLGNGADTFNALDKFTQGYITAMFFTNTGNIAEDELNGKTFDDLAPETLASMIADAKRFQTQYEAALAEACTNNDYDAERAGHDFWYSRNGHGVNFTDRDLNGDVGETLADACGWRKPFGELDPYVGDDGKIYFSGS